MVAAQCKPAVLRAGTADPAITGRGRSVIRALPARLQPPDPGIESD